jgi:integrase
MPRKSVEDRFAEEGCVEKTRETYRWALRAVGAGGDEPAPEVISRAKRLAGRSPKGTALPVRAALGHWLIAEKGYTRATLLDELAGMCKGRPERKRYGLSNARLAAYYKAVDAAPVSMSVKTILRLLPQSGLRAEEICTLRLSQISRDGDALVLTILGKGQKQRRVFLVEDAQADFDEYLRWTRSTDGVPITDHVFPGRGPGPISGEAVRKAIRDRIQPMIGGETIVPHELRHTYATTQIEAGVPLTTVQTLMGHESIETTQRYVHPTIDALKEGARLGAKRLSRHRAR